MDNGVLFFVLLPYAGITNFLKNHSQEFKFSLFVVLLQVGFSIHCEG